MFFTSQGPFSFPKMGVIILPYTPKRIHRFIQVNVCYVPGSVLGAKDPRRKDDLSLKDMSADKEDPSTRQGLDRCFQIRGVGKGSEPARSQRSARGFEEAQFPNPKERTGILSQA